MTPWKTLLTSILLLVAACSDSPTDPSSVSSDTSMVTIMETAEDPTTLQRVDFSLATPERRGFLDVYSLTESDLVFIDRIPFAQTPFESYVQYWTPAASASSFLLGHVTYLGDDSPAPREYVCFRPIHHHGNRHQVELSCDSLSTATFYMSAARVVRSDESPFVGIEQRIQAWTELYDARSNDLMAFFISAFSTLENALLGLGSDRFDPRHQSIRPVMETVITQALDIYQRTGILSAQELINLAAAVTGHELPLGRLIRFPEVYEQYAHVEDVQLHHTGGTLTRRSRVIELLTLSNELERFFLRDGPLEMADYRTHTVQGVHHTTDELMIDLSWDPLPHMYGYNVYLDKRYVGSTLRNNIELPAGSRGVVTIRAVGHAGEFDGLRYDLDGQLVAETHQ